MIDTGERATPPGGTAQVRLLDSVAAITHHRDVGALDHSMVLTLAELTAARSVSLARHDGNGPMEIVHCESDGNGGYRLPIEVTDPSAPEWEPLRCFMAQGGTTAHETAGAYNLLVPILQDKRVIGALQLQLHSPTPAGTSHLLAEGFARIYANYATLLHESERDKLTGLYNRRSLERQLRQLLKTNEQVSAEQPADEQPRVWLAILDIDHFKRINDTYGHLIGDEVILLLSQLMTRGFRREDVQFRFGGEEFVTLLGGLDEGTVLAMLERFRQQVAEHVFPQVGRVTISMGYTRVRRQDYPENALERADKALYYAKENGRNAVCGHEDLKRRGLLGDDVATGSIDLF